MCPANSWHHAKDLLHAEVKILLGILRHKKLHIKEYLETQILPNRGTDDKQGIGPY
jgi:hypothetical protein